ncbi:MAG: ribonuclease III [Chloroflexi bacterium]|nr:ribonuclease III [Chloroflexota bacterium]
MSQDNSTSAFEALIGVQFKDPSLLRQALTHSSFVNEYPGSAELEDNERLEFLGDAVLDAVVADMLYRRFPHISEGGLTQLRASLVKTESLAQIGAKFRLGDFLLLGHGEEISGGRERQSTLCRGFEAVIGAMYLDRGLGAVADFVTPSLLALLEDIIANNRQIDSRSELQERAQAQLGLMPDYTVVGAEGPEHDKEFRVQVTLAESIIGSGRGPSKRSAAQNAAADALRRLDADGLPDSLKNDPDA